MLPWASLIVWVCSIQTLLCGAVRLLFSDYKNALAITSVESMFWLRVPPDMSYTRPHTNSCLLMRSSARPLSSGLGCGLKPCCTALLYLPGLENQETKEPFLYRWPTLKYSVTAIESRAGHLDEEPPLSPSWAESCVLLAFQNVLQESLGSKHPGKCRKEGNFIMVASIGKCSWCYVHDNSHILCSHTPLLPSRYSIHYIYINFI